MIDKLVKSASKGLNPYRNRFFGGFPSVFFNDPFLKNAFKDFDEHFGGQMSKYDQPAVDVKETENTFELVADVPGFKKDAIKVDLDEDNRLLTLKGELKSEKEEKDKEGKYHLQERSYSSFQRSFTLPDNVKLDDLKAQLKDGQLKIVLEKIKQEKQEKPKNIKFGIILTLKVKKKTIATQLLKENIEYWNLFDDKIKLDKSILNSLLKVNLNNNYDTFLENFLPLLLKQKIITDFIDAKMIIEVNPTLINSLPKELQLNYNILQVIFDKDILNCVNYLPIEILDSFKFLMFDSVDSSKRKVLLQQFKERYNKD
ncbi:hypothetical protein ABK040_001162 [Willaertia magna]